MDKRLTDMGLLLTKFYVTGQKEKAMLSDDVELK